MLPTLFRQAKGYTRSTRLPDPAKSSNSRQHVLSTGHEFFIRPPPSAVPVDIPYSNPTGQAIEGLSHPLARASGSESKLSAPLLHRRKTPLPLSPEKITELQVARSTGKSQTELSRQFGVSRMQVAKYSFGQDSLGRKERAARQVQQATEEDRQKANWGWNKWCV